ncbi:MAG: TlpA disulfide reductase family protein [Acidobacteriota bacterium]
MTPRLTLSPLGLALAALTLACSSPSSEIAEGAPLPTFALEDLTGERVRSQDLPNRPTVVSFWATWCQPCIREIPLLKELHASPKVHLVSIALDERGRDIVQPFVTDRHLPYPVLIGNETVFQRMGGLAIPYTILLNAEGTVVEIIRGRLTKEMVEVTLGPIS